MISKILCVDDDEITLVSTAATIKSLWPDVYVKTASNGRSALDFFENLPPGELAPEVLLLDMEMPLMNGWEFLSVFEPLFKLKFDHLYIAIHSGNVNGWETSMAESHPIVQKFIPKPLTHESLLGIFMDLQNRQ